MLEPLLRVWDKLQPWAEPFHGAAQVWKAGKGLIALVAFIVFAIATMRFVQRRRRARINTKGGMSLPAAIAEAGSFTSSDEQFKHALWPASVKHLNESIGILEISTPAILGANHRFMKPVTALVGGLFFMWALVAASVPFLAFFDGSHFRSDVGITRWLIGMVLLWSIAIALARFAWLIIKVSRLDCVAINGDALYFASRDRRVYSYQFSDTVLSIHYYGGFLVPFLVEISSGRVRWASFLALHLRFAAVDTMGPLIAKHIQAGTFAQWTGMKSVKPSS